MARERALALMLGGGLAAGCAIAPRALPAAHPASSTAATGRLAGPPAILRARPDDLVVAPAPASPPAPARPHDGTSP